MKTVQYRHALWRDAAMALALALGATMALPSWAAGPAAAPAAQAKSGHPAVVEEDITMFELVPGTLYLNGGIGQDEQARMHKDAHSWPLRMTFSDRADNEFVAGVQLKVFDHAGKAVLRLKDAGPMTYVQLPQGEYRVTASYKGDMLSRMVHVGPKGLDANFHWNL